MKLILAALISNGVLFLTNGKSQAECEASLGYLADLGQKLRYQENFSGDQNSLRELLPKSFVIQLGTSESVAPDGLRAFRDFKGVHWGSPLSRSSFLTQLREEVKETKEIKENPFHGTMLTSLLFETVEWLNKGANSPLFVLPLIERVFIVEARKKTDDALETLMANVESLCFLQF